MLLGTTVCDEQFSPLYLITKYFIISAVLLSPFYPHLALTVASFGWRD